MEGTTPTSVEPIATPTPQATTPTPPVATPTPTPTPTDAPIMAEGGTTSEGGWKGFFGRINWLETTFAVLGVTALTYMVWYYRFKAKQDKMINNELQRQIDEIKMNVQGAMKSKYKSI
jgi:hypothetical protein